MRGRRVLSSHEFDRQVAELGGYEKLDSVLEPVIDGLYEDPYGYPLIQNDWVPLCRYTHTIPQDDLPSLVVMFTIKDDGAVELCEIWPDEEY
jgi:hypothetical protein